MPLNKVRVILADGDRALIGQHIALEFEEERTQELRERLKVADAGLFQALEQLEAQLGAAPHRLDLEGE